MLNISTIFTYVYFVALKAIHSIFPISQVTIVSKTNYNVSFLDLIAINIGLDGYITKYANNKIIIYFYYKNRYCVTCHSVKNMLNVNRVVNDIKNNYKSFQTIKIDKPPNILITDVIIEEKSIADAFKNIIRYECEVTPYDIIHDKTKLKSIVLNYYYELSSKTKTIEDSELQTFLNLDINKMCSFILE